MNKNFAKAASIVTATAAALAPLMFVTPTHAAGVLVTANTGNPVTTDVLLNTATDITLTWTATAHTHGAADTVTLTVSPDPGAALTNCTSADTDLDGDTTADGSLGGFTNTSATYTLDGTALTTNSFGLCVKFPSVAQPRSYSIAMTDSETGDFGAALVYAGHDNDVNVTANIAPTLSFNITTETDDRVDRNVCDLGTVDTTTQPVVNQVDGGAGECAYALAIGTNAQGGFVANMLANTNLDNATADLNDISTAEFNAGVEEYGLLEVIPATSGRNSVTGVYDREVHLSNSGINFTTLDANGGATTTATRVPNTEDSDLATDFIEFGTTSPDGGGISFAADGDVSDTTRVFHALTVGSGTPAGTYDQLVTYTVTATF